MARDGSATVHGPYVHGRQFRLKIRRGGRTVNRSFATREEAEEFRREVEKQATGRSVSDAIEAYAKYMQASGLKSTSWPTTRHRLRALLGVSQASLGGPLSAITPAKAKSLYEAMKSRPTRRGIPPAADTCRNALAEAGTFARWCVEKGWLKKDPFAGIKDRSRRRKGKPQLGVDEARSMTNLCLRRAEDGDRSAIAALCAFLLGLRASEVSDRRVRDIDDGGRVYVVPEAKSDDGKRRIEIPEVLRPHLLALTQGRPPTAPLFRKDDGNPATRYWVAYHVERLRKMAGVRRVTPHGLRGTHTTLARVSGQSALAVAASVGHSSSAVTDAHYVDGQALAAAERNQLLRVVRGGKS